MEGNKFYLPWTFKWKLIWKGFSIRFFGFTYNLTASVSKCSMWAPSTRTFRSLERHISELHFFDPCKGTCEKNIPDPRGCVLSVHFESQRNICVLFCCIANSQTVVFDHKLAFNRATDIVLPKKTPQKNAAVVWQAGGMLNHNNTSPKLAC